MDIDELVRRARPDSSAGWQHGEEGRRVLDEVLEATRIEAPERRRSVPRWSLVGTGVAGAAAAAVLVVSTWTGTVPPPPPVGAVPGATGEARPVTAREVLLAAATRAQSAPAAHGKYWHVRTLDVYGPMKLDSYLVMRRSVEESWDARDPRGTSWSGHRDIGVRPRAAADEKAWRAAGSPTRWTLDADSDNALVLSTEPDKGYLLKDPDPPRYLEDLGMLTLAQVQRLPADPAALKAWVTGRIQSRMGHAPGSEMGNHFLFGFLSRLLLDTPAAPDVRASAFRILADLPGVRGLGTVQDASGRSGQGVEFVFRSTTEQLIIDGSTHILLASNIVSNPAKTAVPTKEFSTLVLTAEWSDAAPRVPGLP
jgi:hypothetical protein